MIDDPVPRALTALVDEMLGSIPGISIEKVGWLDDGTKRRTIDIHATAWGPSLHQRHRVWTQDIVKAHIRHTRIASGEEAPKVDADMGSSLYLPTPLARTAAMRLHPEQIAEVLRPCLAYTAFVQNCLSRTAATHGIRQPLPRPAGNVMFRDLHHLRIDQRLADLLAAHHGGEEAIRILARSMALCITTDSGQVEDVLSPGDPPSHTPRHGITAHMGTPSIWTLVPVVRDEALRMMRGDGMSDEAMTKGSSTYDGMALTIGEELPETIVAAARGRPVMDIGETGIPSIDTALITDVYYDGEGGTCLELPSGDMLISDHPILGPALTRLTDDDVH